MSVAVGPANLRISDATRYPSNTRAQAILQIMSIYRGYRPLPSDVQVLRVSDRPPTKEIYAATPSSHQSRRAQPSLVLLPRTAAWIECLPKSIQPMSLALQFPRIANSVCAVWLDQHACSKYLSELLTDLRGGRKGFPIAVLREIEALRGDPGVLQRSSGPKTDWGVPNRQVRERRDRE